MLRRYIDKYVSNIDLDKLSLWGGDMVLRNLELDVEVLEREAALPVSFLSARVGKVVVHIPWTSLSSQPVTVTVDLVECVVATKKVSTMPVQRGRGKAGCFLYIILTFIFPEINTLYEEREKERRGRGVKLKQYNH